MWLGVDLRMDTIKTFVSKGLDYMLKIMLINLGLLVNMIGGNLYDH